MFRPELLRDGDHLDVSPRLSVYEYVYVCVFVSEARGGGWFIRHRESPPSHGLLACARKYKYDLSRQTEADYDRIDGRPVCGCHGNRSGSESSREIRETRRDTTRRPSAGTHSTRVLWMKENFILSFSAHIVVSNRRIVLMSERTLCTSVI